jgi:hypothetical protein
MPKPSRPPTSPDSPKRLAKLSIEEDKVWVEFFTWYLENGWVDEEADQLAWKDLQQAFPRLQAFEGAEAEVDESTAGMPGDRALPIQGAAGGSDQLAAIAKQHLGIETLETQHSDSLDFHDLSVWSIKAALQAAFDLGSQKT